MPDQTKLSFSILTAKKVYCPFDNERYGLKPYQVDIGDMVYVAANHVWWIVVDTDNLGNDDGYDMISFDPNYVSAGPIVGSGLTMNGPRVLGKSTSGIGGIEELTGSGVLDLVGTTRGSVLYRGSAGWAVLAPGTSGYALTSAGAGADPIYVASTSTITGTANQVLVNGGTTAQSGAVTLSLPTSIANVNSITAQTSTDLTLNSGSGNKVYIPGSAASSSTTTGALVVTGGVGIGGNFFSNGTGYFAGNVGIKAGPAASVNLAVTGDPGYAAGSSSNVQSVPLWTSSSLSATGNIYDAFFTLTGAGTVPAVNAFLANAGDIGTGTTLSLYRGFYSVGAPSGAGTLSAIRAFEGAVGDAANKWNLYMSGTAKNFLNGTALFGTTTDSANGKIQIASHTTSAGGIGLGTDLYLHRLDSNTIRTNAGVLYHDCPNPIDRGFFALTNGALRWAVRATQSAETGSNVGSDFLISAYDDSGTLIGAAMTITRATMVTKFDCTVDASALNTAGVVLGGGISVAKSGIMGGVLCLNGSTFTTGNAITGRQGDGQSALSFAQIGGTECSGVPLVSFAATWNNAANTPTALRVNITDTASNAASLLADLQIGGSSKFSVDKGGTTTVAGDVVVNTLGKTLSIKSGTNAKSGTFSLMGGAATVNNTSITANSTVLFGLKTASGTISSMPRLTAITVGTSFVVAGAETDNSTYNYVIVELG
jgi:hypothetical protein